ncbi:50S ribosomal protein L32 [Mycoplasmopsis fermentans]|uniref:Large ribosomal subunit protein bL32 n=1 Tax=Mycoplasmopsis fermentans (strain M64) TaxID=943945 RepID=A0AB32XC94_MYCFM|nr:50S ribosomal protein L32 [Mycoplasmopsis fermentans]VEU67218.1 50S ribosomal protein L32 [Mesomycoplasma conjunctivae]ADN69211.1 predicted 50S ribosomal protein L32 [Mycoplasmopsis fermentans JER]ADV34743.1 50S ribosomal protein L32 [Mycoplasmopsis fermentans M64]RMX34978.1 ribosomal protein L32 [Mycoplasmopsis fermentans MF-I1]RMX35083.1 ribosomal protein L32 [Mycoplasmopsis fermentans MF-I2]
MAIVPKRKTSKQRKHKRRTHDALPVQNLVACKNCSQLIQQHRVCESCGFYKGKKVEGYKSLDMRNA